LIIIGINHYFLYFCVFVFEGRIEIRENWMGTNRNRANWNRTNRNRAN